MTDEAKILSGFKSYCDTMMKAQEKLLYDVLDAISRNPNIFQEICGKKYLLHGYTIGRNLCTDIPELDDIFTQLELADVDLHYLFANTIYDNLRNLLND